MPKRLRENYQEEEPNKRRKKQPHSVDITSFDKEETRCKRRENKRKKT